MPKLFFVDDQGDFLPTLKVVVVHTPGLTLEDYVGSNKVVERFITAINQDPQPPEHFYLLDINMQPVPQKLKLTPNIWPMGYQGEYQYCGIALAKWLTTRKVPENHIALCSHWVNERDHHQELLDEMELTGINWIGKHQIINLLDQLKRWEPSSDSLKHQELKEQKGGETHHD